MINLLTAGNSVMVYNAPHDDRQSATKLRQVRISEKAQRLSRKGVACKRLASEKQVAPSGRRYSLNCAVTRSSPKGRARFSESRRTFLVRSAGKMSDQRIPWTVREEARMGLTDWWADRIDTAIIGQLCSYTGQADTRYTGNNATVAASDAVYPNSNEATEGSISTTSTMSLAVIDKAVTKAKTRTPLIRPLGMDGIDYIFLIHPYQTYNLRQSAATAGSWADIVKFTLAKSGYESQFATNALGVYNRCLIVEDTRVPATTTNVRRSVLCGAQAAVMAVGQDNSPEKMSWVEELFDRLKSLGRLIKELVSEKCVNSVNVSFA